MLLIHNQYYSDAQTVGGNISTNNNGTLVNTSSLMFSSTTGVLHPRSTSSLANYFGLDFFVNDATNPRMRISSTGNIAIGDHSYSNTLFSLGASPNNSNSMKFAICELPYDETWKVQIRYGMGHFGEYVNGNLKRVFAFYITDPGKSRYAFFDDYAPSVTSTEYPVANANGYEFVTFNAANRSVGICMNDPTARLHVKSLNTNPIASFESATTSNFASKLNVVGSATNATNAKTNIDSWAWNNSTSAASYGTLYLQSLNPGNVGIGDFSTGGNHTAANSKLHLQGGNFQITNSGTPPATSATVKMGLTMGHLGNASSTALNQYSWIQSVSGPLLLNPNAGNTLTTQTNNYVGIGLTKDAIAGTVGNGYNLLVGGKILCEELKIKLNAGSSWYDYVLQPDYKLITLDSLELFINQNSHLPDIPSEAEVKENGIMAGEMNGLLLKKVEELTLYMIEQNKNAAAQAEQIELLKKQNELLMKQMEILVQNNKTK
jgi:hypothetical protein